MRLATSGHLRMRVGGVVLLVVLVEELLIVWFSFSWDEKKPTRGGLGLISHFYLGEKKPPEGGLIKLSIL